MAQPAHQNAPESKPLAHSGFEKKGGYPATGPVVSAMPKAPSGPAPGSGSTRSAESAASEPQK